MVYSWWTINNCFASQTLIRELPLWSTIRLWTLVPVVVIFLCHHDMQTFNILPCISCIFIPNALSCKGIEPGILRAGGEKGQSAHWCFYLGIKLLCHKLLESLFNLKASACFYGANLSVKKINCSSTHRLHKYTHTHIHTHMYTCNLYTRNIVRLDLWKGVQKKESFELSFNVRLGRFCILAGSEFQTDQGFR